MNFWKYCEQASKAVGDRAVMDFADVAWNYWSKNKPVKKCVDKIQKLEKEWKKLFN